MNHADAQLLDRITGCLVGGALGDALGAPLENLSPDKARAAFRADGPLRITSNTQLTMVTAQGLIRASQRWKERGVCSIPDVLRNAYQRWLQTEEPRGRAATLKAALCKEPSAESQGNGAVTRVAPVGLTNLERVDEVAAEIAALSHPHPDAQQAAGELALMVQRALQGHGLAMALTATPASSYTARGALDRALRAVAVTCLSEPVDFLSGVEFACCEGGAADAVGSLTGQLLGCQLGYGQLPPALLERLEWHPELRMLARDLWMEYYSNWEQLYPPY